MKRFLFCILALSLVCVLCVPQAMAAAPAKYDVCHIDAKNDVVWGFLGVVDIYFGDVIIQSGGGHMNHGDMEIGDMDTGLVRWGAGAEAAAEAFRDFNYYIDSDADCFKIVFPLD